MADCEHILECPFVNDRMVVMPFVADVYKDCYCQGDFADCARYRVIMVLGPEGVPDNLFPNELARADEILGR